MPKRINELDNKTEDYIEFLDRMHLEFEESIRNLKRAEEILNEDLKRKNAGLPIPEDIDENYGKE